jgi:hypothetical protein
VEELFLGLTVMMPRADLGDVCVREDHVSSDRLVVRRRGDASRTRPTPTRRFTGSARNVHRPASRSWTRSPLRIAVRTLLAVYPLAPWWSASRRRSR